MISNKGITLVSLVVTIIILIILAGVSINLTLGENGIITMAKRARENMELAQIDEEKQLNELYEQIKLEGANVGGADYDLASRFIEFKQKVASAITDMGIETLETANAETMASNIRSISTSKDAASITYDNTTSGLASTNVQGAVDELDGKINGISNSGKFVFGKTTLPITYSGKNPEQFDKTISFGQTFDTAPDYVMAMLLQGRGTFSIIATEHVTTESFSARFYGYCSRNS